MDVLFISFILVLMLVVVFCVYQQYKIMIRAEDLASHNKTIDEYADKLRQRVKEAKNKP